MGWAASYPYTRGRRMEMTGVIPIQEGKFNYDSTRGLVHRFLTYIPCSQRERKGSRRLAATRLSLYEST